MDEVDRSEARARNAEFRAKVEKWHDDDKASSIAYERWTLASLVLLNGAAIVALLGIPGLSFGVTKKAVILLLAGVISAVAAGQVFATHYHQIAHVHLPSDDDEQPVSYDTKQLTWAGLTFAIAKGLIWFSLSCFVLACLTAVFRLEPKPMRDAAVISQTK